MTDAQKHAMSEIELMKSYNAEMHREKDQSKRMELVKRANQSASKFKDVDNNKIGDFFLYNAKDNCNLGGKPSVHDFHQMFFDEIKAIKGDTQTLLNE